MPRTKTPHTLAERLQSARGKAGKSQSRLSLESGVPLNVVRNIEQGLTLDPRVSTLLRLARAIDVTLDDLAG